MFVYFDAQLEWDSLPEALEIETRDYHLEGFAVIELTSVMEDGSGSESALACVSER